MNVLDFVDTRQGTNNQWSLSKGNTLPYTTEPFGMNAFVLQSRMDDVRFFNSIRDYKINVVVPRLAEDLPLGLGRVK